MSNGPAKKFRIGAVTATIWGNEGSGGNNFYSTKISRSYKNAEGEWQESDSFNTGDLLNVAEVARRAEQWIADEA